MLNFRLKKHGRSQTGGWWGRGADLIWHRSIAEFPVKSWTRNFGPITGKDPLYTKSTLMNCSTSNTNLLVQLNEYETYPYFLHNFHSDKTVCLIIHVFCKSCKPEIVLAVLQIKTKTILHSQILQNGGIIKQTVVLLWKFWRKYRSVSYLFSCIFLLWSGRWLRLH